MAKVAGLFRAADRRDGRPWMFVQAKAVNAHGSTSDRYLHARKNSYPDAAELTEARLIAGPAHGASA
jgi:hypothetical protein